MGISQNLPRKQDLNIRDEPIFGLGKIKVYSKKPRLKVEYELTAFGRTLIPVVNAIYDLDKL
ncbi:winged helix-turn-helix transcriptional regulator [Pedobacter aquatilis]|uniref:winged helix-turn-helix transcriptional regulator n=1 Tax=Pedobacter aquatilis TaxID=351343 RepID=UPI003977C3BE